MMKRAFRVIEDERNLGAVAGTSATSSGTLKNHVGHVRAAKGLGTL